MTCLLFQGTEGRGNTGIRDLETLFDPWLESYCFVSGCLSILKG